MTIPFRSTTRSTHGSRKITATGLLRYTWLALLVGYGGAANAESPAESTEALHAWLDQQYEEELRFSPETLTLLGRRELYDQLGDYSLAAQEKELSWYESSVAELRERFDYDALDAEGRSSYDFWIQRLEEQRAALRFSSQRYELSQLGGAHVSLPQFMIAYHEVNTAADMEAYISRLAQIGSRLDQVMERIDTASRQGILPPRFAQETVITQMRGILGGAPFSEGEDSPLWADAKGKIAALRDTSVISDAQADSFQESARKLLLNDLAPAYQRAIDWFEGSKGLAPEETVGASELPDGDAFYAAELRRFTTTDLTAAEIHQLGLNEVARIRDEMIRIMQDVGFDGSLAEFFTFVRDDDRFYYADTAEGRQRFIDDTRRYLERVEEKLPDYFGILPKTALEVRRVEPFREQDGAAAFYEQGTPDATRPGVYYMHLSDMRANNLTDLQTTAYHEGNPGHHLQSSIALEREGLPLFRRNEWHSGYGEGWALYAEQVAWEMGVYDNPYYNFGRLNAEMFRAIRLVVDTGIHAFDWSEQRAIDYMLANSAIPEAAVRSEIQRYIVLPGQATAYKVGMLKILELRDYSRSMLGDDFDLRAFHDTVLSGGSLPLTILERRVRGWVASRQDYRARLRRGSYGIAHIEADDYGSLGYGEGYAASEDHLCNIAWGLVEARGELARFFGPDAGQAGVTADALIRALDIPGQATKAFDSQSPELKRWLAGYAAGYNRYLEEQPTGSPGSWCEGASWLRPASPVDFMARMVLVAQTVPLMGQAVAAAQPPSPSAASLFSDLDSFAALDAARLEGMGSNAWAFGSEMTENGRGLLLANPHYPWYGTRRFWEKHLTIPGELDVYGVHLLGAPGVSIGFNRAVGWSHTVSASQRLVLYRLQLAEGDPLRYHYGDEIRDLKARTVSVPVLGDDGRVEITSQTIWFSHYGPLLVMPNAGWDNRFAYTVRDANAGNFSLLAQWQAMDAADSMDAFIEAHRRFNALPWVNTMATSRDGRAVYLDNSTVGHLSEEAQQAWHDSLQQDPLAAGLYRERGMVLLNGSDPRFEWIDDPRAAIAGTVPFDQRPRLERSDYIFNANDSYWLSSPRQPLTGYSILYGSVETARSLRTRMNIRLLENRYGDAGDDGRFNRREIQQALFSNRGLAAELLLPELRTACRDAGDSTLTPVCNVLDGYDGHLDLDSRGAVLFREWLTRYDTSDSYRQGHLFSEPFDPQRPESTPSGLGDRQRAVEALRAAAAVLERADLDLDVPLGKAQFAWRDGRPIPVHGGISREGVANLQMPGNPNFSRTGGVPPSGIAGVTPEAIEDSRYLTDAGYPVIHGSSFIMTLTFEEDGPVADALLSYGQSGNPASPHFRDQTERYAAKTWRPVAFNAKDVDADTVSERWLSSPVR